jgi:formylglycine-generating enzyme required for sulfatase activity
MQTKYIPLFVISLTLLSVIFCNKNSTGPDDNNNNIELEWIAVSGGTLQMGCDAGAQNEQPVHTVTITGFEISKYEITNAQYCEFLNSRP